MKIVDHIKPYLDNQHNTCLDIGCRHGDSLIPFMNLKFEKIHGLEIDLNCFDILVWEFIKFKNNYCLPIRVEEINEDYNEIDFEITNCECKAYFPITYREFEEQSVIIIKYGENGDILKYETEMKYDVIILSNILHFIHPMKLNKTLDKISSMLSEEGIIYICVNTLDKCLRNDWENKLIRKDEITFTEKKHPNREFYLFNESRLEELKSRFSFIEQLHDNERDQLGNLYIVKK